MKLLILGAGGYGRTVADLAPQLGIFEKIAFLDDGQTGENILGVCGDYPQFADGSTQMYPAFGSNTLRMQWLRQLEGKGISVPALIHPRAYVSPAAVVCPGAAVLAMAVVNTGVTLEAGSIVNIGAIADHDCVVSEGAHLAPGAIVKAANRIPAGMKIESGAVIENGVWPL